MIMYLIDFLIEGLCGADQEIDYYLMECVIDWLKGCVLLTKRLIMYLMGGMIDWLKDCVLLTKRLIMYLMDCDGLKDCVLLTKRLSCPW